MSRRMSSRVVPAALWLAAMAAPGAFAAESEDGCTYNLVGAPVTLSSPGNYCVAQNITTSDNTQPAITIASDEVELDCNGLRIDATALGSAVAIAGIQATDRANLTIRNCHVRGFRTGIELRQRAGSSSRRHLVEDNRVELSRATGIVVAGDASVVRRNLVQSTLAPPTGGEARAISTDGRVDVLDNRVAVVQSNNAPAYGIHTQRNVGASVRGNRVHGVRKTAGAGAIEAIHNQDGSARMVVRDNTLTGEGLAGSVGVGCDAASDRVRNNVIKGFAVGIVGCSNDGNVVKP
jgi:hypothetical protein